MRHFSEKERFLLEGDVVAQESVLGDSCWVNVSAVAEVFNRTLFLMSK